MHGTDVWTERHRVMSEWYANPLVWIGVLSSSAVVTGVIFAIGQWKGKVDSDRSSFKRTLDAFMSEIRVDIKRIFERLPPAPTVAGASPLRLTEPGREISDRLDASAIADNLVPELRERVADMQPYDIQELCYKYIRNEYEPPDDVKALILQYAFDNGIDREQVLDVIAIELRDRLLPNPPDGSPPPVHEPRT